MDAQVFAIWFMLPVILLVEAVVTRQLWGGEAEHHYGSSARKAFGSLARRRPGIALIVAVWLVLTAALWVYEFVIAQVLLYVLLFSLGRFAAALGLLAFVAALAYTPVACWRLIWRLRHGDERVSAELPRLTS